MKCNLTALYVFRAGDFSLKKNQYPNNISRHFFLILGKTSQLTVFNELRVGI
ncbi:MAG: hypothetical protein ACI921_001844 [Polaribacter sp.]|jgi:hypothetical protein